MMLLMHFFGIYNVNGTVVYSLIVLISHANQQCAVKKLLTHKSTKYVDI